MADLVYNGGALSVGNDLDNAWIRFDDKWLDRATLLDRYADVAADDTYRPIGGERLSNMELIGQRLFTGRVAVAQGRVRGGLIHTSPH